MTKTDQRVSGFDRYLGVCGAVLVVAGLLAARWYSYLLFHSLAETFVIVVAFSIFVLTWNSRGLLDNNYLLFLGISCLFIGALHAVHSLAYKGMGVFPGYGANLSTQIWIVARYGAAGSFLIAPLLFRPRLRIDLVFLGWTVVTALLLGAIFSGSFPACFTEGQGLTSFKKVSEYVISGIFLVSLVPLYRKRDRFDRKVFLLIAGSVIAGFACELPFGVYHSVFDFLNVTGHLLLILSAYLLYKAIIVTGLQKPHEILFRELKQSEQILRESEERYRALFNQMSEGFAVHEIICDESGKPCDYRFLDVNPAFERLTGLRGEQVVGKTVREVVPGTEPYWIETYGRVALSGEPAHLEQYNAVLGRHYEVVAYSPGPGRFATVFMDVTERRHGEEVRREAAEELARSNQELERFCYIVSHDLQAPLRTVTGYLQLIEQRYKSKLDAEADEFIRFAVDGAGRMRQLIEDLLAYSRVTTRVHPLKPTDCNRAIQQAVANLQAAISESGAGILHDGLPTVEADGAQLVQLFQNLIDNAIKFRRREEPPKIQVRARQEAGNWRFSVSDNGIGIEPQYLERIFEMFQRLHSESEYPGSGLGLAICKKIVERHGGRIWAESGPGPGTTFFFTIPCGTGIEQKKA